MNFLENLKENIFPAYLDFTGEYNRDINSILRSGVYVSSSNEELDKIASFGRSILYVIVLSTKRFTYNSGYGIQIAYSYFSTKIIIRTFHPSDTGEAIFSSWRVI